MSLDVGFRRLPIVVGITGHRHLRPQDEAALAAAVDEILARLQSAYPSTPLLLLTPLAEGADWLAADVARRRSIPYRVPLPMPLANYREDFAGPERLARFDELLRGAAHVSSRGFPGPPTASSRIRAAGPRSGATSATCGCWPSGSGPRRSKKHSRFSPGLSGAADTKTRAAARTRQPRRRAAAFAAGRNRRSE
jgi:hypothetical protein